MSGFGRVNEPKTAHTGTLMHEKKTNAPTGQTKDFQGSSRCAAVDVGNRGNPGSDFCGSLSLPSRGSS